MDEINDFKFIYIYLLSILIFGLIFYSLFSKKIKPFNAFDYFWYLLFIICNFIAVIMVLIFYGYISLIYIFFYLLIFGFLFIGIYFGGRFQVRIKPLYIEKTIFCSKYFYPILIFSLISIFSGLLSNFNTWMMDGDPHLNRIQVLQNNAGLFYFSWVIGNSTTVYLMLSALCSEKKSLKILSYLAVILTVIVSVTGASRSGVLGQIFQISLVLYIVKDKIIINKALVKLIFIFLFLVFSGGVIYITAIKGDERNIIYVFVERLVFSADAIIYQHVFLQENFEYHLDSSWNYFLHPLLRLLDLSVINAGIGPSMSAALSGELTGRGPVSTFMYDGLYVFGFYGALVYSFFVGFFLSFSRKILVYFVDAQLILKDFFAFFFSVLIFFLGGVLINDLLTFSALITVASPILFSIVILILFYKNFRI